MGPDFLDIVRDWLLRPEVEGKFSNDPDDPGGLTKWGITVRDWPEVSNPNFTQEDAEQIYYEHYWKKAFCHSMPIGINILVFDMAVNMGVGSAIKILQRALGVLDDGIFGANTANRLDIVNSRDHTELMLDVLSHRTKEYNKRILRYPKLVKYSRGWAKRMFRLYHYIVVDNA